MIKDNSGTKHIRDAIAAPGDIEATNAELRQRVAELEARLRFTAESLRSLSPGPHPGPMNAEEYILPIAKRVAELEENAILDLQLIEDQRKEIADLEAQLAWTPVSAGLPTADGGTNLRLVACDGKGGAMLLEPRLNYQNNEWKWCTPEFPFGIKFGEGCTWEFRRIELPGAS